MPIENGGPAFPVPGFEYLNDTDPSRPERVVRTPYGGMTLRDYFAAQALPQLMAYHDDRLAWEHKHIASEAYAIADAMLAARKPEGLAHANDR